MRHLAPAQLGQTLVYAPVRAALLALTRLPTEVLAPALDSLEPDDAAALLAYLPEGRAPLLAAMSAKHANAAKSLLTYKEDTPAV